MDKIALIGESMCSWDGGIDFLINIAKAISKTDDFTCTLVLPKYSVGMSLFRKILQKNVLAENRSINKISEIFSERCPQIPIKFYNKIPNKLEKYNGERLDEFLISEKISIALPVLGNAFPKMQTPWIGYIPDLQEHYFPEFFSEQEIAERNTNMHYQLDNSKYILVNSNTVKNDIFRFFPGAECELFVIPFAPIITSEYIETHNVNIEKYCLPEKYFIISNQFWAHKSHLTAFKALKELHYSRAVYQDVHIVCTGKMDDYRNEEYCKFLIENVRQMNMQEYIHFLGYIPKYDQIEIMKHSKGLIQPTLLEGGPGGGSLYEAVCLGIPCILSDIPVNQEAKDSGDILYFEVRNAESLKNEMIKILEREEKEISLSFIIKRMQQNSSVLCEFYKSMIKKVMESY